jgi:hypothetical protein
VVTELKCQKRRVRRGLGKRDEEKPNQLSLKAKQEQTSPLINGVQFCEKYVEKLLECRCSWSNHKYIESEAGASWRNTQAKLWRVAAKEAGKTFGQWE